MELLKMDDPIDVSSGSDEEVQDDFIRKQDGTIITDEKLIYQAALQDLNQPKTERDLPYGVLSVPLMKHQKIALEWMRQKEKRSSKNCLGGMLADDQGLGKTISTIALILLQKLKSQSKHKERKRSKRSGGTLVVCPASVVKQWAKEIYDKVSDEQKLSVLVYHGSNRTKDATQLAKYDVVVTTYALVTNEVPQSPMLELYDRKKAKKSFRRSSRGALAKVKWSRVVLDEAQTIKNYRTQVARACCSLRAKRRWCLSGTPIQNEIMDLYSYFRFLRYYPYAMHDSFRQKISLPISKSSVRGYKKLQAILRAIMLRRTKETILDGQRIINLPPKIVNFSKMDFSLEEYSFYSKLEASAQEQFEAYAAEGTVYQNYASILVMLLRLRQACDHPNLVNFGSSLEFWKEPLNKIPRESLITLLSLLHSSSTICCSVCKDPPKERLISLCEHVFCYDCVMESMLGIQTCPVPGCSGRLVVDAVFSESILRSFLEDEDEDDDYDDDDDDYYVDYKYSKPLALQKSKSKFISTKIKAVMDVLHSLAKQGSPNSLPTKTIIFSQWTRMLDLVEHCFVDNGIVSRRLDGTMSLGARDQAVKEFNNDPSVQVMLMSLKAGNLGLNMVAACHVILLDLWWNPTTEEQAIDRAHRIGQTRTVTVSRITIKNTVEERILALQEKKREIVASALGEDLGELSATRLTVEDLEYLFYGN